MRKYFSLNLLVCFGIIISITMLYIVLAANSNNGDSISQEYLAAATNQWARDYRPGEPRSIRQTEQYIHKRIKP